MLTGNRLHQKVKKYSPNASAIANKHRLAILYLLAYGPMSVKDISKNVDLPQVLTTHHLRKLLASAIVKRKKSGRMMMYSLVEEGFFSWYQLFDETPFGQNILSQHFKSK